MILQTSFTLLLKNKTEHIIINRFGEVKQQVDNQSKIDKVPKWWRIQARVQTNKNGYYDSCNHSNEGIDSKANINRVELAGIYDEVSVQ